MGLHEQARAILLKPTAAVALAQFDKIHGAVVFVGPIIVFDAPHRDVDQDDATRAQDGRHAAIRQPDVTITVPGISVGQDSFETAPLFDHPRKQFGTLGVEGWVKP
jgi:hypothetical protein